MAKTDPKSGDATRADDIVVGNVQQPAPDAVAGADTPRDLNFIERGKAEFKTLFKEAADYKSLKATPYGLKPILIFTILGAILAIDGQIFNAAAPEIIKDLDLDLIPLFNVLSIIGFFLTFAYIYLAYLSDRVPRTPIVALGTLFNGIFSLFTAGSSTLPALGASRAGDALGSTALSTPIFSLQADFYPPESRGKAFALNGVIGRVIGLAAPVIVAGLVLVDKEGLYWRLPFLITGPLLIAAGAAVFIFLKEPIRGYMERKSMGVSEEIARIPEEPPSLGEAWRTIWAIRTLRRLFIASIPGDAGSAIFGFFFSILLFEKYHLGIGSRAWISVLLGVTALPFGFLSGGLVDVLIRRRPSRVLVFSGVLGVISSMFLFVIASAPPLWLIIVAFMMFGAFGALLGTPRAVLFAQILPAHVRTLGSAVQSLASLPGTILRIATVGVLVSRYGTQGALFLSAPFILISSLIDLSAAPLFERDMRAAFASQLASVEWRRAKAAGRGKMLVCRDIDVEYSGGVQVLFGVDFDVEEGQIIALLGTNGAGKSTLLKAIAGTQEASSGAVVFDGRDTTHMPPHEIAARGVILMPGGRGTFPDLTVKENLRLGNWLSEDEDAGKRLEEVYNIFPILRERGNERAQQLSGGEQQQLSLAQAFLSKPRLLMIDELSLGLAPTVVQRLIEIVKEINRQGTTIIIVEQSVNVALAVAERAIFMEKGEVKFFGNTADLLRRPDILRAVYMKGTGALVDGPTTAKTDKDLRRYELENARPILEARDIGKSFGGVKAVVDATIVLREGESLGLIGPNGAGKTTMFDLISGYQIPDEGHILYDGVDITTMPAEERAKRRLIRRFQDARLFPSLTVYENILVALERKIEVRNVALTAIQVPQMRQSERRVRQRADRLIELLELGAYRDKFVKELSTGLRRITDLACVLAAEPKLLMLDEPSTGIAQAESEGLAPLLRRVRYETGCSMLIIEHDIPLISAISDELVAMVQGSVLIQGTPEVVLNDERLIEAYLGTSENVIQRSGVMKTDRAQAKKGS